MNSRCHPSEHLNSLAGGGRAADATLLFTIINTTSIDFGARTSGTPVNQPVYAKAFGQFIHQLQRDNQPVAEAFANIIASSFMDPYGSPYGYTTDYTGALLELAEAAGSDQSFVGAFQQASLLIKLDYQS